ncbi:phospholipase D family protein [Bdellovibrio sp. HCB209]|uniref:phospholipase D family protein n=1 Tax=Bdellovibrio sp. HCB209 TaxID=3394354 RepID=UPI0039B533CF
MTRALSYLKWIAISMIVISCATLPKDVQRTPSTSLPPDPNTSLSKYIKSKLQGHHDQSGFHPLFSGEDAFVARIASIRTAEKSLDLQYYIWNNDMTGNLMLHEVLLAADRGVRVRVLLDDLNSGKFEKQLRVLASHPQIEIRMANPFASRGWKIFEIGRLKEVNRRMHNKVIIADSEVGIVGGRNIGDEYFSASNEMNFGDLDLWTIGPVVPSLSKEFDLYWNSEFAYPIESLVKKNPAPEDLTKIRTLLSEAAQKALGTPYTRGLKDSQLVNDFAKGSIKTFWGEGRVVYDTPEKLRQPANEQDDNLHVQLRPYLEKSTKEIFMVSPYFVPLDGGVKYLTGKVSSGIRIVILTNSLASSDVSGVFGGYKGYRKKLIRGGVELYELRPKIQPDKKKAKRTWGSSGSHAGLHGKTMLFDERMIFVGSMNLDPRSAYLNSEMGVVVDSEEMAKDFTHRLKDDLNEVAFHLTLDEKDNLVWTTFNSGHKKTFTSEPETSWWQRVKVSIMSVFIPEREL